MEKISRKSFVKGALGLGLTGVLAGCASSASSTAASASSTAAPAEKKQFTFADTVRWDAQYDVVVMGMGAAGMVAAKTAADNGAKVVIVEKCEEGKAGGNTKVCGQLFAYANGDKDAAKSYYTALAGGRDIEPEIIDAISEGVANMADILAAAVLAKDSIKSVEVVDFPELGMEAVRKIYVENFPAFILVDDKGNDFFAQLKH